MAGRHEHSFQPINTTAPGFEAEFDTTGVTFSLQSTSVREYDFAYSHAVQLFSYGAADFWMAFGTSDIIASTATAMRVPGSERVVYSVPHPSYTHIAFAATTSVAMNVTLGYGML